MTVMALELNTRRGTNLPLDQRRRDALSEYARQAADAAGVPAQTWVRTTWKLKDYEAKDLLKANASETVWERLLKMRGHPHGGWRLAIPIIGAVIGEDIADHFASEREQVAHERARAAAEETRIARLEAHARERRSFARLGDREAPVLDGRGPGERRVAASRMGRSG